MTATRGAGAVAGAGALVLDEVTVPRDVHGRVDLQACTRALEPVDLLESGDDAGWHYLVPHGPWRLVDDGQRSHLLAEGRAVRDLGPDPFAAIDRVCTELGAQPDATVEAGLPTLSGGLIGALSYDLGRRVERLPDLAVVDRGGAHLSFRIAEVICAITPGRDRALLLARPLPAHLTGVRAAEQRARTRWEEVRDRLARATRAHDRPRAPEPAAPGPQIAWTSLPREDHLTAVATILAAIEAGAVFQVNLAQRLSAHWPGDVHDLYRALRAASPAAFGAALPDIGVASISPETFLSVDGPSVTTRPIKGTRPRAGDAALDAALADDLATATKDRAENVMVVDLERNDLGRVCRPGTVRVPELTRVEEHPTVWHLVSTVQGELRPGTGYGGLLRATFPCGSITGAPKIAAMALIERLERVRRGWYCGAIGFLAPGHARLSVAIRTAVLGADGVVDHGAGGGIVADSDPTSEHAETLDKAAAFLRAVRARRVADHAPARAHPAAGYPATSRQQP
ncbi:MAG: anthranilate synthase component I family protein [Nitriliruptoraceae bacterium]